METRKEQNVKVEKRQDEEMKKEEKKKKINET
jgi:hypothetical protein